MLSPPLMPGAQGRRDPSPFTGERGGWARRSPGSAPLQKAGDSCLLLHPCEVQSRAGAVPRPGAQTGREAGGPISRWVTTGGLAAAPPPPRAAAARAPPALWRRAPWPAAGRCQSGWSHWRCWSPGLRSCWGGSPGWPCVRSTEGKKQSPPRASNTHAS